MYNGFICALHLRETDCHGGWLGLCISLSRQINTNTFLGTNTLVVGDVCWLGQHDIITHIPDTGMNQFRASAP